jgi:hypothetical protein
MSKLFSLSVLAVTVLAIGLTSRMHTCDCAVCDREVFVLSVLEEYCGPFRNIPAIHPTCAAHLKEHLAPEAGMTVSEWLRSKGYYYTDKELINLGVGTVRNDFDASAAGFNPVTGEDYFTR